MRVNFLWAIFAAVLLGIAFPSVAIADDDTVTMTEDNTPLLDRLDQLDKEMGELKCRLSDEGCIPAQSSLKIRFYGYIKLDASYDTRRMSTGNYAKWVESPGMRHRDDEMNITAKQSRFGMIFTGPDIGDVTTTGKVEVDFYSGNGTENKAEPYMRHAYMEMKFKNGITLLAGQTWDVINPLFTPTINYSVAWWAGDAGYRRPQIRITKGFGNKDETYTEMRFAVTRNMGENVVGAGTDPGDTGEDSGEPGYQARVSVSFPMGERKATIGVSGHWAQEEYDVNTMDRHKDVPSWSGNIDVTLPLGEIITAQGEWYIGKNMNQYLGGIGQGTAVTQSGGIVTRVTAIKARGGWGALSIKPADSKFSYNLGASADHISDHDVHLMSGTPRTTNFAAFANFWYKINSCTAWGFEVTRWRTGYADKNAGNAMRYQTSFIFKF